MADEEIEIKILTEQDPVIPVEEETPLVPERPSSPPQEKAKTQLNKAGQQLGDAAQKAWESEARKKVTGKVQEGITAVAAKSTQVVADKVTETAEKQAQQTRDALETKLKETDWKEEAKTGAARGLQWMSGKLSDLADRFTPKEKDGNQ